MAICFAIIGIGFLLTLGGVAALNVLAFSWSIGIRLGGYLATKYMRLKIRTKK